MAKDKPKVTVVPILNKTLKAHQNSLGEDEYPIYIRVFLGANNTRVPASIVDPYNRIKIHVTEKDFQLIEEDYLSSKALNQEVKSSILALEVRKLEQRIKQLQDFHNSKRLPALKLTGLSKKLRYLYTPVKELIAQDVSQKLYDWVQGTPYFKKLLPRGNFNAENPLEQTVNYLIDMYGGSEIGFPEDVLHELEFAFLFKAYSSDLRDHTDAYDALMSNGEIRFADYLEVNKGRLFNKDIELKLPLRNRYSRFVSLFPPSNKLLYINILDSHIKKIYSDYEKIK